MMMLQTDSKSVPKNKKRMSIPKAYSISYAFTAEDESNRFEIYSLKLNCVLRLQTDAKRFL